MSIQFNPPDYAERWRGNIPVPKRVCSVVRDLFETINERKLVLREVSELSGVSLKTISDWRYRSTPNLDSFVAVCGAVGLTLRVRSKRRPRAPRVIAARGEAEQIICAIADANGISPAQLRGRSRFVPIVRARDATMLRIHTELGLSSPEIGSIFNRDHSTVLWALRRARKRSAA